MKFGTASYLFFLCASTASALRYGDRIHARDVVAAQAEALAKPADAIAAPEAEFDINDVLEEGTQPEARDEDEDEGLVVGRSIITDAEKEILEYLRNMKTDGLTSAHTWPTGAFEDLHGDSKSGTGGKYVCQVRRDAKAKKYLARVVAHETLMNGRIKKGHVFKTVEVAPCKPKKGKEQAPGYGRAVHFLRKAFGGAAPPACRR
ncbi:uncharacterized protein PG998_002822 [Apiospora kogelbergensis]|uniref:uncharacterized protein n=1 Tax=Apiospora kogelbergensis TaxID=1337665 RepID=UPI00312D2FCC